MAVIPFRFKVPTPDNSAGAGYVDSFAKQIGVLADLVTGIDDDDDAYASDLVPAYGTLLNGVEGARRIVWSATDDHYSRMAAAASVIKAVSDAAAANVPTSGHGDHQTYASATDGARSQVRRQTEIAMRDEALARIAPKASEAGGKLGAAFDAACDAVDDAYSDWAGPASLSRHVDWELEDLSREASAMSEIRGQRRPMAYLQAQLSIRLGSTSTDPKKMAMFLQCARSAAVEVRDTPPPKLQSRYANAETGTGMVERDAALDVLRTIEDYRRATCPPSLRLAFGFSIVAFPNGGPSGSTNAAPGILNSVRDLVQGLIGVPLNRAAAAEFLWAGMPLDPRRAQRPGSRREQPMPWQLMPGGSWPARFLGGVPGLRLPGWSPVRSKTGGGVPVREPAGR
jgi:hypothetical protein